MRRLAVDPRPDWQARLDALDFDGWRREDGSSYWVEDACFEFSESEIEELHLAALECEAMILRALEAAMTQDGALQRLGLNPRLALLAEQSWRRRDPSLYGRFDFAWDGQSPPKLLEYNADTPTALYEAAVVQWRWLIERDPNGDQYNSIHERLIDAWRSLAPAIPADGRMHFVGLEDEPDDAVTLAYLKDCAMQAGIETVSLDIAQIGLAGYQLVDLQDRPITHLFKLYPWEWMAEEDSEFFTALAASRIGVLEPPWRVAASSKGLLVDLWEANPDHPNLLPASRSAAEISGSYVAKPLFGREGANVLLKAAGTQQSNPGPFGDQPLVYQGQARMGRHGGRTPVFGVWVVSGEPCGLGIREDESLITSQKAWFVPHRIV